MTIRVGSARAVWVLLVAFGSASIAKAEPTAPPVLTLEQVLREVEERNPAIHAARASVSASRAREPQASALPDPMVFLERRPAAGGMNMTMVGGEQMVPFPAKLVYMRKAAGAMTDSAEAGLNWTELDARVEAIHAYHHLYHVYRGIEINLELQSILRDFIHVAETRYLSGTAGQSDVLQAQLELTRLMVALTEMNGDKAMMEADLRALMNRQDDRPLGRPTLSVPTALETSEADLWAIAQDRHPALRRARSMVRAAESERAVARSEFGPDLTVRASNWEQDGTSLGVGFMVGASVPVWFWPRQTQAVREASAELERAENEHRERQNGVRRDLRARYTQVKSREDALTLFDQGILPQARQALQASSAAYRAGRGDFLTMLEATRAYQEAELGYEETLVSLWMALGDLERAVGVRLEAHAHGEGGH